MSLAILAFSTAKASPLDPGLDGEWGGRQDGWDWSDDDEYGSNEIAEILAPESNEIEQASTPILSSSGEVEIVTAVPVGKNEGHDHEGPVVILGTVVELSSSEKTELSPRFIRRGVKSLKKLKRRGSNWAERFLEEIWGWGM